MKPSDPMFHVRAGEPAWPGWVSEFRPHQIVAIEGILDAYERGIDVVMLDAPTGSGKTIIAEASRRALGVRGVYVCNGKDLQDQFLRDFTYSRVLKGRANYPTEKMPAYDCGDCTGKHCSWCTSAATCPYKVAKRDAGIAPVAVLNTAYFLAETQGEFSLFAGRKFVVADESDTLEGLLMNHVEFRVSARQLQRFKIVGPVKSARVKTVHEWLTGPLLDAIASRLADLASQQALFGSSSVEVVRERNRLGSLRDRARVVAAGIADGDWGDWVRDYDDRNPDDVILKPVTVSAVGATNLWPKGKRWLCMSGSIISAEEQAESLGIEEAGLTWEQVRVPMTFPAKNRPIKLKQVANMTYRTQREETPKLIRGVKEVLAAHPDDNVLVHTVNYRLAEELTSAVRGTDELGSRVALTYRSAKDREYALSQFTKFGGVLFAPSMDRGIDLPGDLCRVQIIAKIPFPSLKDRQIAARMSRPGGQQWYQVLVARTLLQMTGRAVRSSTDTATTYILDRQFGAGFWSKGGSRLLPDWWKEALQ